MPETLKHTALYDTHIALDARMVPFAGWEMPIQYRGIFAESLAVRSGAGLFDVSHMGRLDISGPRAPALMDWVLTAHASDLRLSRARYALMCNEAGGIIDDTVYYRTGEDRYLLVCNASNRQHVVAWLRRWAEERFPGTTIEDRTEATAMIALQGPSAVELLASICDPDPSEMRLFSGIEGKLDSRSAYVGRTGYTGEDGFELITEAAAASYLWHSLMDRGGVPCGLGARDVLRLEAGLSLHGNDIGATTTPMEAGLDRFVHLDKDFVGAEALRRQMESGPAEKLVGLAVQGKSIARAGTPILSWATQATQVGKVTSGTHSPTLDSSIAMGYVTKDFSSTGERLQVDIRGRLTQAEVVPLPFYSRKAAQ